MILGNETDVINNLQPKPTEEELAERRAQIALNNKRLEEFQKTREEEEARARQLQDEAGRQEELEAQEAIKQAEALAYV